jgi:cellulose synthase/poly-beta-1,6-N-acetylglucosamine synthase-like glycosyltransferase
MLDGALLLGVGVAVGCALLVAYTFVGYPLAVHLLARWRPRPVRPRSGWQPNVAIVVVMHNEAARVDAKLRTCLGQDYPHDRLRVVLASDGSTDDTVRRALAFARGDTRLRVEVLPFAQRRGKAACLNDAVLGLVDEVVVFTDARQPLNASAVSALVETLSDPSVSVVSGELDFRREGVQGFGQGVDAYWRYEKFIRKAEARIHSVPGATGALYAIRRSAFRPIDPRTVLDDVAIPMQACLDGGRVVFDGRALAFDDPARDAAQERARKVRTLAGNFQILALMPGLLVPGHNPIWWQYMSHKVLRLLAPWALLGLLVSTALLAPHLPLAGWALMAQLLFYAAAIAALSSEALGRLKLLRLAGAFVALNGFAVLGLWASLRNPDLHRWQRSAP